MGRLWVFGYGSLMWRPGFPHDEVVPATLQGAHRALCVYSVVHRGTRRRPGLVLGLNAGGRCQGLAFRVEAGFERQTRAYLKAREQVTRVYREAIRPVELTDGSGRQVRALCFLVDRFHPQYAGALPIHHQVPLVREGRGRSGHNLEYLFNTLRHLDEIGIEDKPLKRLGALCGSNQAHGRLYWRAQQGT